MNMNADHRDRLRAAFRRAYGERYDRAGLEDRVLSAAAERRMRTDRQLQPLALVTAVALVLAIAVVGTLLALGHGRQGPTPAGQQAPSPAGSPAPSQAPSPSGSPLTTATPRCDTSDLTASIRALNPAAGQRYAALDLTNVSGQACQVYGYVGMLLLDAGHHPLPTTAVWGAPPSSPAVVLEPGQVAFAQLHWATVPGFPDEQASGCLPAPSFVEITPPDETTQLVISWDLGEVCLHGRIDVLALAAGTGPPN
jgi:hypothetical protein